MDVIRLAFLGDLTALDCSWNFGTFKHTVRQQNGLVQVDAVWSQKEEDSKLLNERIFNNTAVPYWERKKHHQGKDKPATNDLKSLVAPSSKIAGIVICARRELHMTLLNQFLSTDGFNKHIFSTHLPTLATEEMSYLVKLHTFRNMTVVGGSTGDLQKGNKPTINKVPNVVWMISDVIKMDSGMNMVSALLPDVGIVIGGQIDGTSLPHMASQDLSLLETTDGALFEVCARYSTLMRKLFGEIISVNCTTLSPQNSPPNSIDLKAKGICGTVAFESGATCSINFSACSLSPHLELRVWGTLGNIHLTYDPNRNLFEISRYLKHFEHPTLHNPTGASWCLSSWLECINDSKFSPDLSPIQTLMDITIAEGMVSSNGALVGFRPVPILPTSLSDLGQKSNIRQELDMGHKEKVIRPDRTKFVSAQHP